MGNKEQKEQFKLYKEDVERRGKAFFPHAMFHDTVMSLVVVSVIVGLAAIWYFTSSETPDDSGILGPRYKEEADPGTVSFTPRPDWYFFFLFYLLRIFKWPESVILATIGIPTILLILLLSVPFIDRRRERRLIRRPVAVVAALLVIASMGILTYKGAVAKEAATGAEELVPEWIAAQNLPAEAEPGAILFAQSGCLNCHVYTGAGASNLGAPELTEEGERGRGIQYQIDHLKCPSCVTPGSQMPAFDALSDEQLRNLAVFLEASKGVQG
jgi:menaquinol-cytochrome c reductase cytochrome b/c subunit